jgi:hypothetical protein
VLLSHDRTGPIGFAPGSPALTERATWSAAACAIAPGGHVLSDKAFGLANRSGGVAGTGANQTNFQELRQAELNNTY